METMPTAEELINLTTSMDHPKSIGLPYKDIRDLMIRFAKLHVEAALKVANEEAIENDDLQGDCYSGRYHMKNCYPLENIK